MILSFNQKLAAFGFTLSLFAMLISIIAPSKPKIKYADIVVVAEAIKNRESIQIIDLREPWEFEQFSIPTSQNYSLSELSELDSKSEHVVLYSNPDSLAIKGFYVLNDREIKNPTVLSGGATVWYDLILYPTLPIEVDTVHQELVKQIKELSTFYGGRVQYDDKKQTLENYTSVKKSSDQRNDRKLVRMGC